MATKITIIGAGSVGATMAYTLSLETLATEIVLIDINNKKADGEALDILQSTAYRDPIDIKAGTYQDAAGSNIVIITSGMPRKPGMTRLDLAKTNVNIIRDIASQIAPVCPYAKYIIVSNPVDILTYVFMKESGIPESQIIGSGTQLDTARLRSLLAEELSISQKNVHAYIFGEHGDTSFIPWSCAYISGLSLKEYEEQAVRLNIPVETVDKTEILTYVQKSGGQIIAGKGATFYAVSSTVTNLCDNLLSPADNVATFSSMLHGEYGIEDVALSILTIIGPDGVKGKIPMRMNAADLESLRKSAEALKEVIKQIEI